MWRSWQSSASLMYKYTVEEYHPTLPFIMVEQTLIDMKRKVIANGTHVTRYGTGWINVAIPLPAFVSICNKIKSATRYGIDDSNFTKTRDGLYVTTVASINENKKP